MEVVSFNPPAEIFDISTDEIDETYDVVSRDSLVEVFNVNQDLKVMLPNGSTSLRVVEILSPRIEACFEHFGDTSYIEVDIDARDMKPGHPQRSYDWHADRILSPINKSVCWFNAFPSRFVIGQLPTTHELAKLYIEYIASLNDQSRLIDAESMSLIMQGMIENALKTGEISTVRPKTNKALAFTGDDLHNGSENKTKVVAKRCFTRISPVDQLPKATNTPHELSITNENQFTH